MTITENEIAEEFAKHSSLRWDDFCELCQRDAKERLLTEVERGVSGDELEEIGEPSVEELVTALGY